jgi:hypothetical protein
MEKPQMEEISEELIPTTEARVQSSSNWRQA